MMVASNVWNVGITLGIVIPPVLLIGWIARLLYYDSQDMRIEMNLFPRLIPWTAQSRLRRVRTEVDITEAQTRLHDLQHARLQKQIVLEDLESERMKRALGKGDV